MHRFVAREPIAYDGSQIRSHWAYLTFGLLGDSAVAFVGPCDVKREHMMDLVDVRSNSIIVAPSMLHFVVEHFDRDLERAILRQRLLAAIVRDAVEARAKKSLRRDGSDLFHGVCKLSVSVATVTPVSAKIHFGLNIEAPGDVGVPTLGLRDLDVCVEGLAEEVLERYEAELASITEDRAKVRPAP